MLKKEVALLDSKTGKRISTNEIPSILYVPDWKENDYIHYKENSWKIEQIVRDWFLHESRFKITYYLEKML